MEASSATTDACPQLDVFGAFVREQRLGLGLTQTQLAERLGWVQERISLLENGKYGMPSLPALGRLAVALETSLFQVLQSIGYDMIGGLPAAEQRVDGHGQEIALLYVLQRLLAINSPSVGEALNHASDLVAEVMSADKVDAFFHDPAIQTLVAVGTSNTPMGRKQREIAMDRLQIVNRGREVEVFETGTSFKTGNAQDDPGTLIGIAEGLGVQSEMIVALTVAGTRRGVLLAASARPNRFTDVDLAFLEMVADWIGMVAHRAELAETVAADRADRARRGAAEELMTVLAHDLGNLATPLKGRIDILRRRIEQDGHLDYLDDVNEAGYAICRMQRLIDDLLDAARLEQGVFSLSIKPTDLVEAIQQVTDELRTDETPIYQVLPDDLMAEIDASRICQALENVVSNAIRHTPSGVPVIVRAETETRDDGRWAVIMVRDEGPGIAPEMLPTLFLRFATGPDSRGLGLGLYLARGIAEAHGGTLTVDSTAGTGSSFILALPLRS